MPDPFPSRRRFSAWSPALAWVLVVCWALIVLTLALQPGDLDTGRRRLRLDPTAIGHVGYFAALTFLLVHALRRHASRRAGWWAITAAVCFGILIELVQVGVPGRTSSLTDLAADLVGALIGAVAFATLAQHYVELMNRPQPPERRSHRTVAVAAPLREDGR